jgi:ABC-type transport system involved in multi-copper enzyme maturation permease subunit
MSRIAALIAREVRAQVFSPIAWVVWTLFLFLSGWFFVSLVYQFIVIVDNAAGYAEMMQNREMLDRLNLNDLVVSPFGNLRCSWCSSSRCSRCAASPGAEAGHRRIALTAPVTAGELVAGKFLGLLAITGVLVAAAAFAWVSCCASATRRPARS